MPRASFALWSEHTALFARGTARAIYLERGWITSNNEGFKDVSLEPTLLRQKHSLEN
jgi:hypothetical protein